MHDFSLIAFDNTGAQVARHKIENSIKKEIKPFRESLKLTQTVGISLYDNKKGTFVSFGIFQDADGDEYVKIG
jgi:hypothetical protein